MTRWSDGSWRRCRVEAWDRPEDGYRHILSARKFDWLVLLKFPEGADADGWYCFEPGWIRPV